MSAYTCKHGATAPQDALDALPESQAGVGRHRCTTCAVQYGKRWMLEQIAKRGHVPFMCDGCGQLFREPKWHCSACNQHSPTEREACVHCAKGRRPGGNNANR